jgi:TonB family protein
MRTSIRVILMIVLLFGLITLLSCSLHSANSANRSQDHIYSVMQKLTDDAKTEYLANLAFNPTLTGTITYRFVIAKDGSVSNASIVKDTTGDGVLGNMILALIEELDFGPSDREETHVVYPFSFSTTD